MAVRPDPGVANLAATQRNGRSPRSVATTMSSATAHPLGSAQTAAVARLAVERDRTEVRLAALTRDFTAIVESVAMSPPDDEHDPEGATTAFERQQLAALIDRAREHLADLDRAGERLRDGTYGDCSHCGRPVAPARLEARPTATMCVPCASTGLRTAR